MHLNCIRLFDFFPIPTLRSRVRSHDFYSIYRGRHDNPKYIVRASPGVILKGCAISSLSRPVSCMAFNTLSSAGHFLTCRLKVNLLSTSAPIYLTSLGRVNGEPVYCFCSTIPSNHEHPINSVGIKTNLRQTSLSLFSLHLISMAISTVWHFCANFIMLSNWFGTSLACRSSQMIILWVSNI